MEGLFPITITIRFMNCVLILLKGRIRPLMESVIFLCSVTFADPDAVAMSGSTSDRELLAAVEAMKEFFFQFLTCILMLYRH